MSGIDGASRRRTEELMDTVAHDAGVLRSDEHVHSSAMATSGKVTWQSRNDDRHGLVHLGKEGATSAAEHAVEHGVAHGSKHAGAVMGSGGTAAGTLMGAGSVLQLHFLLNEAWLKPHLKGDEIRERQTNDAINVAVADTLDTPAGFRAFTRMERPGVETGAEKMKAQLRGKDAAMVPVLQARSDEGFLAAQKIWSDVSAQKAKDPGTATIAQLTASYADRMKHDVAFGLGVKLFVWSQSQDPQTRTAVDASVHARNLPNPTPLAG